MAEWPQEPLASLAEIRPSNVDKKSALGEQPVRLCNYMDVYTRDYITENVQFMEATATPAELQRFRVERGDVLITKDSETPDDIGVSAVVLDDISDLICGYHLALLKPDRERVDPVYLSKQLASTESARHFARRANGSTRYGLSYRVIAATPIRSAPLVQQRRIAEILVTLDEAIEQTEALIAKTQQIKAGLMHDLFTRGVTPDGQLRPARAEAPQRYKESRLGWIPKEWEVSSLREVAEIRTGIAKNAGRVFAKPVTVQYLRVANVQDGFLDLTEMKAIQIEASELERYQVLPNDVLMNEGGDLDKLGRGAIWPGSNEPCVHQNHVFVVRCGSRVVPSFLNAWTASPVARRYFMVAGKQTTNLASINKTQLGRLSVLMPPPPEQSAIVRTLGAQEETLLSETEEIAKLRLLKAGLMHDLLTGRVRVAVAEAPTVVDSRGAPR